MGERRFPASPNVTNTPEIRIRSSFIIGFSRGVIRVFVDVFLRWVLSVTGRVIASEGFEMTQ